MKPYITLSLLGAVLSGGAYAECPPDLALQQKMDCIVAEGAGQSYQSYLKEQAVIEQEIIAARQSKGKSAAPAEVVVEAR